MTGQTRLLDRYRLMRVMRAFDEACLEGARLGTVHGELHLAIGQEGIAAGMAGALRDSDALVSTHRNHFHGIVKGVPLAAMLAEIFERSSGLCGGYGGHMHLFDLEHNFSTTGIVGSALPVALGYAYAMWMEEADRIAIGVTGDGGLHAGSFYETLNIATAWRLPLLILVENNGYAISVRNSDVSRLNIVQFAAAFDCPAYNVDGSDVEEVARIFAAAVDLVRSQRGPAVVEASCRRFRGHYEGDLDLYRSEAEKAADREQRDPILIAAERLISRGESETSELVEIDAEARALVLAAVDAVRSSDKADPGMALHHVFVESRSGSPPWS